MRSSKCVTVVRIMGSDPQKCVARDAEARCHVLAPDGDDGDDDDARDTEARCHALAPFRDTLPPCLLPHVVSNSVSGHQLV